MTDKPSPVDQMKEWARTAPPADGPIPDGDLASHLDCTRLVAILLDDKGRAYHIDNINLDGANLGRFEQPRTAINELMDAFGIKDGPNWSAVKG